MGIASSILLSPLTITILLALLPQIESWSFFQPKAPPNEEGTLAEVMKAMHNFHGGTTEPTATMPKDGFSTAESATIPKTLFGLNIPVPRVLLETLPAYMETLRSTIMYKPPVGIVTIYMFAKLIFSRNRKLVLSLVMDEKEAMQMQMSKRRKRRRLGRSMDLDESDGKLNLGLGGAEPVRAELCRAALCDIIQDQSSPQDLTATMNLGSDPLPINNLSNSATLSYYANAARDALSINASPGSSREYYVESTIEPLSRLDGFFAMMKVAQTSSLQKKELSSTAPAILLISARVAEIRTLDALLRILRDRLLVSAVRLSRKEKYRIWRLQWYETGFAKSFKRWCRQCFKGKNKQDDRRNLQLTTAALKREMKRLGEVQQLLLTRPKELSETSLLMASSVTVDELDSTGTSTTGDNGNVTNCVGQIDVSSANLALGLGHPKQTDTNNVGDWSNDAQDWTKNCRALVFDLVTETISAVYEPKDQINDNRKSSAGKDLNILNEWSVYAKNDREGWNTALLLVENLSKARLMRETKYLPNAVDLRYWWNRVDFYGIPTSLATIGASWLLHETVKPYWPGIVEAAKVTGTTIWGIIEYRFWTPFRDIILDLLNRRPKLLDPFDLVNEETSLDNMLRDLGVGDGSKGSRKAALAAASRLYEEELAQGAIRNLLRGKMITLLLIQIQQLKSSVLEAMGTVDDMVESNRLNVQLLASIPAVLLVTFGTRLFFAVMFSFRSRDLVGLPTAHAEMSDILRKMERCLLLASYESDLQNTVGAGRGNDEFEFISPQTVTLRPKELGEFVLLMHSYLVLLDYCSPPFSSKTCDAIQKGMQDLLLQGQLTTKRQNSLLQVSFL